MGMILRIASSRIVGQGDIVGRSGYFSLNLSANSVMRGRLDARRTLKSLVADLRFMTLLHFNGNILQMGVVEMGWGSGALLGGLVLACKALKSKQTLVMHTAYVILGLYLISASYLPSSAFIGFVCLTFTGGIAYSIYHALFIAIIQQNLASDMLGRTFSLIFSLSTFPSMLGIVASGYWVEAWGITSVFMISGWVIFLIGVGANFISSIKQLDNYA